MAESGLDIAIIGATGAVGSDLLEAFERSSLEVARFIPVASPTKPHQAIEALGKRFPVHATTKDGLPEVVLEEADLVVFATPAAVTRSLAPAVVEAGIAVIDVGGALLDMGVLAVPLAGVAIDPDTFTDRRVACSPSGPAVLAATVLQPLRSLGLTRAQITALLPAGVFGQAGAQELSRQVVALFNSADPPRTLFPDGLAFDVMAALGTPTDDWTGAELDEKDVLAVLRNLHEHGGAAATRRRSRAGPLGLGCDADRVRARPRCFTAARHRDGHRARRTDSGRPRRAWCASLGHGGQPAVWCLSECPRHRHPAMDAKPAVAACQSGGRVGSPAELHDKLSILAAASGVVMGLSDGTMLA